jgi:acyl-CoA thioesterase-1
MIKIFNIQKIAFLVLLLSFSAQHFSSNKESRILILGDSISAGYGVDADKRWTNLLQEKIRSSNWIIINASISGDTTGGGLSRIEYLIKRHQPNLLLLELGGNDALRGYPVQKIKSNLKKISSIALEQHLEVLLMQIKLPPNYGKRYVNAFESIYVDLSKERGISYIPFMLESIALNKNLMLPDGIHPNSEAQPYIAEALYKDIKDFLY